MHIIISNLVAIGVLIFVFYVKRDITNKFDSKLENQKSSLQKSIDKHKISFTSWHNKRIEAMEEIYASFCAADEAFQTLTRSQYNSSITQKETLYEESIRCTDAARELNKARDILRQNALYVSEKLYESFESTINHYGKQVLDFQQLSMGVDFCQHIANVKEDDIETLDKYLKRIEENKFGLRKINQSYLMDLKKELIRDIQKIISIQG